MSGRASVTYGSTNDDNNSDPGALPSDDWSNEGLVDVPWEESSLLLNGAVDPQSETTEADDDQKMPSESYQKVNSADQISSFLHQEDSSRQSSSFHREGLNSQMDHSDFSSPEADQSRNRRSFDRGRPCKRSKKSLRKKGVPKRPLTAYNLYFKDRREALMAGNRRPSFQELAKVIGREWHELTPTLRDRYDRLAKVETDRYHREMDIYHDNRRKERTEELQGELLMTGAARAGTETTNAPAIDKMQVLPPGGEVLVPGAAGLQAYRVEYKAVRMKQKDVDNGNWLALMQQTGSLKKPPPPHG